jgi:hypothetical protein
VRRRSDTEGLKVLVDNGCHAHMLVAAVKLLAEVCHEHQVPAAGFREWARHAVDRP